MATEITGYLSVNPYGFSRVPCLDVDGVAVYQGDIVLGTTEHMKEVESACQTEGIDHFFFIAHEDLPARLGGLINTRNYWPDRVVYYEIDASINDPHGYLHDAIVQWNNTGIYRLFPRVSPLEANYIKILNAGPGSGYFSSSIGMKGGMQKINLQDGFPMGTAIHEIGHAIGMFHQQSTIDAQSYVNVLWNNIRPNKVSQFQTVSVAWRVNQYDYSSIMHYSRGAFAQRSGLYTLKPYDDQVVIGQRTDLSYSDLNSARAMYNPLITRLEVVTETGSNPTNSPIYLGIGGREFRLDNYANNFERNQIDIFKFGYNPNVNNARLNDPSLPAIALRNVMSMPVYIRMGKDDGWSLTRVSVEITSTDGIEATFYFEPGPLLMETFSTEMVYLVYKPTPFYSPYKQRDYLVNKLDVHFYTGAYGTDEDVFLGIGGREFRLDTGKNDFKPNQTNSFLIGAGSNILNPQYNDPFHPQLYIGDVHSFPIYIRKSGDGKLSCNSVELKLQYKDQNGVVTPPANIVEYKLVSDGVVLGKDSGKYAAMKFSDRISPTGYGANVKVIQVQVKTEKNGTNSAVYLRIGGREFRLNTSANDFKSQATNNFSLGDVSNVLNPGENDPRDLTQLDIFTYNVCIRMEGSDHWDLGPVTVKVIFDNNQSRSAFFKSPTSTITLGPDCGMRRELLPTLLSPG